MNRILEDDDLMTAYQYEVGKIHPFFRFTNKKDAVIRKLRIVIMIAAAVFAGLFFLSGRGESVMKIWGMHGSFLLKYPKASLIIFFILLAIEGLLTAWLKIASKLEEDAFTAASRVVFNYRLHEEKREKENRQKIILPAVEAHKAELQRLENERKLVDASEFFATRIENKEE